MNLDDRELAAILAALRYWQQERLRASRQTWIHRIATNGGRLRTMTQNEIDDLCERLNTGGALMPSMEERYRAAARELYADGSDDTIVVDNDAEVGGNVDGGRWVQAWVRVPDDSEELTDES